jgi:hypothetical protein
MRASPLQWQESTTKLNYGWSANLGFTTATADRVTRSTQSLASQSALDSMRLLQEQSFEADAALLVATYLREQSSPDLGRLLRERGLASHERVRNSPDIRVSSHC